MRKIGFNIKKILLILVTIILVITAIKFVNFQKQDTISINAIALDNYGYLDGEEFELKAKDIGNDLYEIELPKSINQKVVAQAMQVVLENDVVEIENNKIVLTKEQVKNEKIELEVSYDVAILERTSNDTYKKNLLKDTTQQERENIEITEETELLYSKILKHEDTDNGKLVELSGFLPKDAELQVEELSQERIIEIFGDKKIDVAYDIKILVKDENGETVKVNPEDFGETCKVLIKDENIVTNSKVYHVKDDNTLETVEVKENIEESISFEARSFSVYAVGSDDVIIEDDGGVIVRTSFADSSFTEPDNTNGVWVKSQTVTLTGTTGYTVNGYCWSTSQNTPSDSGWIDCHLYSGKSLSIPSLSGVEGIYYLHIRAVETTVGSGYGTSYFYAGEYLIDGKGPTNLTVKRDPSEAWIIASMVTFKVSATDNFSGIDSYEYKMKKNGSDTWYTHTGIKSGEFNEGLSSQGEYTYTFTALDKAGNKSTSQTITIKVDHDSPNIKVSKTSSNEICKSLNINITAAEDNSEMTGSGLSATNIYQYYLSKSSTKLEEGEFITYTNGKQTTIGTGKTGKYYLFIKSVTDIAGHRSEGGTVTYVGADRYNVFGPYYFDNTPPKPIINPSSHEYYSQGKTVNVIITDDNGFKETPTASTVKFKWYATETKGGDDEAEGVSLSDDGKTFTATYHSSIPRTGRYYLGYTIDITDSVGNTLKIDNYAGPYYIDNTAPTITLSTNENTTWSKTASVAVTITDDRSKLTSGASIKYGWSTSKTTEPTTYKDAKLSYSDAATSTTFTATASGLTGKYYLWVKPITLKDKSGNSQTTNTISTGTFYMDNTVPTAGTMKFTLGSATGSAYTAGNWTNQDVYLKLTNGTDAESGHKSTTYKINGTASTATSIIAEGEHTIVITTTDNVGNTATKEYKVKIDKTKPTAGTMKFTLGSATGSEYTVGNWTNKDVYLKLTNGTDAESGHKSTTYTIDGKASTATSITADGTYTIVITTTDNAGNSATKTYTVKIDKTKPTAGTMEFKLGSATGSVYTAGNWTNKDLYLKLTEGADALSGHKSTTYTIDEKASTATSITADGTHEIVITTTDNAGNTATKEYTVKIDKTKPVWGTENIDIDEDNSEVTAILIGQDETGLANTTFDTSKLTVEIGNQTIDSKNITLEETLSTDGKTKTITIKIKYTNGGPASIIIDSSALVDLAGNTSTNKTYSFVIEVSDIITSSALTVTEDKLLIRDINPKTTAKILKEKLVAEMEYNIINTKGEVVTDTTVIGTGYKIKMANNKEYTLIVRGDINGDGEIKLADLARISRIFISSNANPSELEKLAIDVSKNGKIELNDITVISRLRLAE